VTLELPLVGYGHMPRIPPIAPSALAERYDNSSNRHTSENLFPESCALSAPHYANMVIPQDLRKTVTIPS